MSNNNNAYQLGLSPDTFSLQFDENSRAEFSVQYPDAGELSLSGTITNRTAITGSSNIFKVRPFGFAMDILNDEGTSINPNGYATDGNGTLLKRTGEDFVLGLRTVQWVDGEDTNNDGIPDDFNDFGVIVPTFAKDAYLLGSESITSAQCSDFELVYQHVKRMQSFLVVS